MSEPDYDFASDEPCGVHQRHTPKPSGTDLHHVWPKGMGGPDVAENKVPVCATGHQNIHRLLRALVATDGDVKPSFEKRFHPGEQKYARLGFERFKRGSL